MSQHARRSALTISTFLWLCSLLGLTVVGQSQLSFASPISDPDHIPPRRLGRNVAYVPIKTSCPNGLRVSLPQNFSVDPLELDYINSKAAAALPAWKDYLNNVALDGLNVDQFLAAAGSNSSIAAGNLPNVALAMSGGGYRSMLYGGSILNGFDSRNDTAVAAKTGGILQLSNYLAGLSGGAWLTGSWSLSDGLPFRQLNSTIWKLETPLFLPEESDPGVYQDAIDSIAAKMDSGYPTSFVDAYGRFLSYHLINNTDPDLNPFGSDGPGSDIRWSSIVNNSAYRNFTMPYPILLSVGRNPETDLLTLNSSIYEISPLTFSMTSPGALDASVPTQYLGTEFSNGIVNGTQCIVNYDNAGFLMGSSSDVFGDLPNAFTKNKDLNDMLAHIPDQYVTTARIPNPFRGMSSAAYPERSLDHLNLIDGGLADENVPIWPFLRPGRAIDVILAIDGSSDTDEHYPNASALYATSSKVRQPGYEPFSFPVIPDSDTFINEGMGAHPTFFGCSNSTLVVYIPNHNMSYKTGTSTWKLQYSPHEVEGFFENGFQVATQNNNETWAGCLACALIDRQLQRNGSPRTPQCSSCFEEYCWEG